MNRQLLDEEAYSFFPQNPNATLPALVADGKPYDSTIAVVDYLVNYSSVKVKSRTSVTDTIHEDNIDPNFALLAVVSLSMTIPYSHLNLTLFCSATKLN